ncbi:pilus assembly protein CpaE [Palleronia aestuarii]|uniref:Pilus assembly protein CpaE n=1 Tax=Palleronia aestuarii TaxID=568105 RepID=A0A2W7PUG9_9RHOB|nr:TadE/TadG family type IV pilus assembly protein [Palleronia aestuarii]PZX13119.1 pilus assembly protein CpaE [Palleronia aestuarii]
MRRAASRLLRPVFAGAGRRFRGDERGVSAVEFALLAPMIFFGLLSMTDIAFALRERMWVDQILRSGGQPAMRGLEPADVEETMERATCTSAETYPDCAAIPLMTFSADRYCICPTTEEVDASCTATCAVRPMRYYEISATKSYDGIFLPQFDFAPTVLVEAR